MMKKSKISLFVLVILSAVGLVFLATSSVNATAPAGTISYWKLDEDTTPPTPPDSPVTYIDSIPVTGNNGEDNGNPPTPTDGRVLGAQQFDGLTTGIDIQTDGSFDWGAGESFSIELWLRQPNAVGAVNEVFVGREANDVGNPLQWWVGIWGTAPSAGATPQAAAFVLIDSANGGADEADFLSGSIPLAGVDSDWHHIVAVRDAGAGANGTNFLYVDGTQVGSVEVAYSGGFAAADDLNIGYINIDTVDGYFTDGAADEIALYNRALTECEIDRHYQAGLDGDGIDTPQETFEDVPPGYWAEDFIYTIFDEEITAGCSRDPLLYCPEDTVSRAEMAIFLGRAKHGSCFTPPPATGIFDDVPVNHWAAAWIEQAYVDGITNGCSTNPLLYCPDDTVTRDQMAVFLLRAEHDSGFTPPPATGIFDDVPVNNWAAAWIEQLFNEEITSGCSSNPPLYCPDDTVTRAEIAVFLVRTFDL